MQIEDALKLIERIAFENAPDDETGPMIEIWKIAHAFSGVCVPHDDWKRDAERLYDELPANT